MQNVSRLTPRRFGWALCTSFAGEPLGRDLPDLHLRVEVEQPDQLATGVPGSPRNRRRDHDVNRYRTIRSGMFTPVVVMLLRNSMV